MVNDVSEVLKNRVSGIEIPTFFSVFCSQLNLPKPVARKVLFYLQTEGHIEVNWHHPTKGAVFYVRMCKKLKKKEVEKNEHNR
ncbi:MAG: hypothetical protein NT129_00890 [Candidatus Aenigmarchaeota archaeon]|nr:hypothetical protein [Candidatus Aenigmarchaeota archaeon]